MITLRHSFSVILLAAASLVTGCVTAPQQALNATPDTWAETESMVIGISIEEAPEPNVFFPGAGCLLCIATAETAHTDLSKQVSTFATDPLDSLPEQIVALIEGHGARAVVIDEEIDEANLPSHKSEMPNSVRKDYSSIAEKHGITHLLDVDIHSLGVRRHYSAYVPTSDPVAILSGRTMLIDLSDHIYEVYQPVEVIVGSDGEWKEPPTYPGLTNAYYQMLEESKAQFVETLKAKALPVEEPATDEVADTTAPQEASVQ